MSTNDSIRLMWASFLHKSGYWSDKQLADFTRELTRI